MMVEKVTDSNYKKHLQTVVNTAGLLLAQVKSHMDSSLRERGLLKSQLEKESIHNVVQVCIDMLQDQAGYCGVELVFERDEIY
jgi:hypothetical protein